MFMFNWIISFTMGTSIIIPCEKNRMELLQNTLHAYGRFKVPEDHELVIVSRDIKPFRVFGMKVGVLNYRYPGEHINPAMAFNTAVARVNSENIIITSPEVMPITNVLQQFKELGRGNYIAQVWDMNEDGTRGISLVNKEFRGDDPSMYFLAHFKKEDILKINGWDEEFMEGHGYEDTDFGHRWVRAGIPFEVIEKIQAEHQWHPRGNYLGYEERYEKNRQIMDKNNKQHIIKPKKGLRWLQNVREIK